MHSLRAAFNKKTRWDSYKNEIIEIILKNDKDVLKSF